MCRFPGTNDVKTARLDEPVPIAEERDTRGRKLPVVHDESDRVGPREHRLVQEAIVLADIDLKERSSATDTWGFLKNRKPAEYGDLVK